MSNDDFDTRLAIYLALAKSRPELFQDPPEGIRILLEPNEIRAVEQSVAARLAAQALPVEGANVGVVLVDPWFFVIRDAVEFPDGARRMHARVVNRIGDGAAVLPFYEGKVVLIRHFRHPLRRAILEIPRGGIEVGSTALSTALNEIREEIGGEVARIEPVGFLYGSSNLYANGAHLFFAELGSIGQPQIGEGIISIERYSIGEFESLICQGEIVDAFAIAAYTHSRLRNLL